MARVYLSPPHIAGREAELVAEAIESNWIAPLGPHVDAFEAEVAAAAASSTRVALSSGTAALHLALVVARHRRGRRGRVLGLHVRRQREPDRVRRRDAVLRRRDEATWTIDPTLLDRAIADRRLRGAASGP